MNKIPRQYIYLIVVTLFLFIFVLFFSFALLIPTGKEYRIKKVALKKSNKELFEYQEFYDETLDKLKTMQSQNRTIIQAFDTTFNPQRFEKMNTKYFSSLHLTKLNFRGKESAFAVYEVNTTSEINSPTKFYKFLDAINKSDWIIGVNFPITFHRDQRMIQSSFTMKVYCNNKESNETSSVSVER